MDCFLLPICLLIGILGTAVYHYEGEDLRKVLFTAVLMIIMVSGCIVERMISENRKHRNFGLILTTNLEGHR